jgi:hypothetical protein
MRMAEFRRTIDDFLISYKKRRPHWSPEVLAPHEKFPCSKLARFAEGVRFLPGLDKTAG